MVRRKGADGKPPGNKQEAFRGREWLRSGRQPDPHTMSSSPSSASTACPIDLIFVPTGHRLLMP